MDSFKVCPKSGCHERELKIEELGFNERLYIKQLNKANNVRIK